MVKKNGSQKIKPRMLIGITGASGVQIAIKILEFLIAEGINTELIISKNAKAVIKTETSYKLDDIYSLTTNYYKEEDLNAPPASGSHKVDSMIIVPCSMKTLSAIANGYADNLIARAADVAIKEKRKLILVVRESPFNAIHLENMLKLARLGVIIAPPIPSYYIKPESVDELIEQTAGRILGMVDIDVPMKRWGNI
jgi:4-hydroxy-3-polyprenylbenzoate decarboxylase